jgi:lipopolysaccharide/colanic/teichoic acid biosynthesis glycosyltransferase
MPKFRSMRVGADREKTKLAASGNAMSGVRFKLKRDPRVTAVGRILRRFSIDEMPQLWSVLRGDMTLIGPRPALPREVDLYEGKALRRLEVKPGLTCLWQIGGRSDLSFEQQVDLDIEYIDRSTFLGDLSILLKTVPAVLTGRGAY